MALPRFLWILKDSTKKNKDRRIELIVWTFFLFALNLGWNICFILFYACFLLTSTKPSSSASILAIWNNLTIWNTLAYSATFNPCPKVWYGVLWMNNLFPTKSLQIIAQEFPLVFPESAFAINWNRKLWDKTSSNAQSWEKWTVTKDSNEIVNPCNSLFPFLQLISYMHGSSF